MPGKDRKIHLSLNFFYSLKDRIIGYIGLKGAFKSYLAQTCVVSRDKPNKIRLIRAPSSLTLDIFMDGVSTVI